jgi:hypothetical protein
MDGQDSLGKAGAPILTQSGAKNQQVLLTMPFQPVPLKGLWSPKDPLS